MLQIIPLIVEGIENPLALQGKSNYFCQVWKAISLSNRLDLFLASQTLENRKRELGCVALPVDLVVFGLGSGEISQEIEYSLFCFVSDLLDIGMLVKITFVVACMETCIDLHAWNEITHSDTTIITTQTTFPFDDDNILSCEVWRGYLSLTLSFEGNRMTSSAADKPFVVPIHFNGLCDFAHMQELRGLEKIINFRLFSLNTSLDVQLTPFLIKTNLTLELDKEILNLFKSVVKDLMFIVICSCDFETFVICDIVSDCRCYMWKEPKYLHYAKLEVNSQSLLDPKTTSKYFTKYFKSCKKWIEHVKKKSTRQTSKQSRTESDNPPNANPFQNNNSSIVKHERNIELELKNKQSIKKIIYLALHMKGITKSNPEFPDLYRDLYEKTKTSLEQVLTTKLLGMQKITEAVHSFLAL